MSSGNLGLGDLSKKLADSNKLEKKSLFHEIKSEKFQKETNAAIEQLDGRFKKFFEFIKQGDLQKAEDQREFLDLIRSFSKDRDGKSGKDGKNKRDDEKFDFSWLGNLLSLLNPLKALNLGGIVSALGGLLNAITATAAGLAGFGIGFIGAFMKAHGFDVEKVGLEVLDRIGGIYNSIAKRFGQFLDEKLDSKLKLRSKFADKFDDIASKARAALPAGADAKLTKVNLSASEAKGLKLGSSATVEEIEKAAAAYRKETEALRKMGGLAEKLPSFRKAINLFIKIKDSILNGIGGVYNSIAKSGLVQGLDELFMTLGGGKLLQWFSGIGKTFAKFKALGETIGKIFAPLEAAWYIVSSAFADWQKAVDEGASTFEQVAAVLMGAGKGALEWLLSLPGLLAGLIKNWILVPIMKLFGLDEFAAAYAEVDPTKMIKHGIDSLFKVFERIGEWFFEKIQKLKKAIGWSSKEDDEESAIIKKQILAKKFREIADKEGILAAKAKLKSMDRTAAGQAAVDAAAEDYTFARNRQNGIKAIKNAQGAALAAKHKENAQLKQTLGPVIVPQPPATAQTPGPVSVQTINTNVSHSNFLDNTFAMLGNQRYGAAY